MGKRSAFTRNKHDAYDTTDARAVRTLLPHLAPGSRFIEPCAGAGDLIVQLEAAGHVCVGAIDVAPRAPGIVPGDAATFSLEHHDRAADLFCSNPPWTFEILRDIIFNLFWQRPTWLLLGADFKHNIESAPYMAICRKVVSIGRLRWVPGTKHQAVDNCCWYLFDRGAPTEFIGRRG